jgi:putative membrane protein
MMWDGHDGMGWWMLWGSFLWIIFIAARLAGGTGGGSDSAARGSRPPGETPLDIARRRYAAGEINREEFEQIRRDLG